MLAIFILNGASVAPFVWQCKGTNISWYFQIIFENKHKKSTFLDSGFRFQISVFILRGRFLSLPVVINIYIYLLYNIIILLYYYSIYLLSHPPTILKLKTEIWKQNVFYYGRITEHFNRKWRPAKVGGIVNVG